MQIQGQDSLPAARDRVWAALNDVELLRELLAGHGALLPSGAQTFECRMALPAQPQGLAVQGRLQRTGVQAPARCRFVFDGQDEAGARVEAQVQLWLEPQGPGRTLLHYTVIGRAEGQAARTEARAAEQSAQALAATVLAALGEALRRRHPAAPEPPPPPPRSLWQRFLDWYLGWLGKIFTGGL
ncbi:hypothetical protein LZ017_04250 [Pelomonas sp. CA6]|uniref:CoxG family protein n=1 Tax=Pelomonas sp. CA6 TaxID=2907999 RepID=UPI001F4B9E0B|nr:SRPBCC domain-containing protein [Pelomonas sp. CA6]MCH7342589.1 hypothetical protein [Pelomonas sp. CA6]